AGPPTPFTNVVRGLLRISVSQLGDQAQLEEVLGLIEGMARTRIADDRKDAPAPVAGGKARELRVGYVGLGAMGGALARRMMLSRPVRVYDASPEVSAAFARE